VAFEPEKIPALEADQIGIRRIGREKLLHHGERGSEYLRGFVFFACHLQLAAPLIQLAGGLIGGGRRRGFCRGLSARGLAKSCLADHEK